MTLAIIPKPTKTFIAVNKQNEFMELNEHEIDRCHDLGQWKLCAHGRIRYRQGHRSCLGARYGMEIRQTL